MRTCYKIHFYLLLMSVLVSVPVGIRTIRIKVGPIPADLTDYISPDGLPARDPQVAMDDDGNAIITWRHEVGSSHQIYMSEYRNGAWTHPSGLSDNISPDGQDAQGHQVAMDDNGNAIIKVN
jgi:hypothetical protein